MNYTTLIDDAIVEDIPGYDIVIKEDSTLMKRINIFARIFNKQFMTRYTTTLYPDIYVPRELVDTDRFWKTKAHEWVHLCEAKRHTSFINSLFYGFPQTLAPLALLALGDIWGSSWFLLNLLWLLCLAPIPAYFRMKEEMKAYAMSMACNYWRHDNIQDAQIDWIADHFTSSDYYYMWPFKANVRKRLVMLSHKIQAGHFDEVHPFDKVKKMIKG